MSRRVPTATSSDTPSSRTAARKNTTARRWPRRLIISALVVATIVMGVRWVLHRPYFSVEHVTISGLVHEPYGAVLARSGLAGHPAMIDVNPGVVTRHVETFTWIRSATVQRRWPNTVAIVVHERTPVAVAHEGARLYLTDQFGHQLAPIARSTTFPLLVATGAPVTTWPFDTWAQPAARVAGELPPAFASQVAVVHVDHTGNVSLTLTSPLTFQLGPATNLRAKFVSIAAVIAHGTLHAGDVVDVSVPGTLTVTGP